jgi:hypothetical protein
MAAGWATTAVDYLNESLDDADVRKNLARGAESIRHASRQMAGRRPATKAARKTTLQRKLRDAVFSVGRAGAAAREAEHKRQRSQRRRLMLLFVLVGASVAFGLSGPARSKARGLFGGQDQVSEPPPPSPPQTPVEPG